MLTIYHNPRCSKSRAGLEFIEKQACEYEIKDYIKTGISEKELTDIINKTGLKPFDLVRTHEELYKTTFKGKEFTDAQWIKILSENPQLLHRPIVVNGQKAVWAQPAEKTTQIL